MAHWEEKLAISYEWQRRLERWKSGIRGLVPAVGWKQLRKPRPQICACLAERSSASSATRCHVCGTSLRFSLAAFSKKFSGIFGEHQAPVTTILLISESSSCAGHQLDVLRRQLAEEED